MNILILGHNGWIGSIMCSLLTEYNINYFTTNIRVNQKTKLEQFIIETKPTHIMSFIGRTHGTIGNKTYLSSDYLEQSGKLHENIRDNLFSPIIVALIAKKYNIHYTYVGTGCIFHYDEKHPYGNEKLGFMEEDTPNFFGSSYSIVKGYTDELMHLLEENVLNIRIRMPITSKDEPRNLITKIKKYEYICSIPNSLTVLDELLPYMVDMVKNKITGTFNLTNPGLISHNEILEMYKQYVDNSFTWKNFSQEEQNRILDSQKSNNCLDTTKLTTLYPEIKNIKDSVRNVFLNWKH